MWNNKTERDFYFLRRCMDNVNLTEEILLTLRLTAFLAVFNETNDVIQI